MGEILKAERSFSEGYEPLRTTRRVVGFKVSDHSPSPTSVLTARESQSTRTDSPRSKLAEALRTETFHPLPRLKLKTTRPQVPGFRRSLSHADLHLVVPSAAEPATPSSSRASASSTPMKIPSTMSRVHTCPIDLSEFAGATFKAALQLPGTLPSKATTATAAQAHHQHVHAHARRPSEISSSSCRSIEECDNESLARDLFQAASAYGQETQGYHGFEEEDNDSTASTTTDVAAVVDFESLRESEPLNNAQTKLRLPAAAVHRRVRSLERP